ncbi:kinase-like domain-containing protein [Lanmaoa asiatica]|nr:kinase-like domain-containing protein [Lanmaoa asiatica]
MSNGTLHSFLKKKGQTLTSVKRLQLVHGIGSGLDYLHSISVFHGDLHSGNVLIDEEHNPRITDFGLASAIGKLHPGLSYLQRLSSMNPGAVRWAAPERLSGCKPNPSGDMYSFGCVMFEVMTSPVVLAMTDFSPQVLSGDIPWKGMTEYQVIALKLNAHKPPGRPIDAALNDQHWALMVECWSRPQRRPMARDVVVVVQTFLSSDNHNVDWSHGSGTPRLFFFLQLDFLGAYLIA